MWLPNQEAKLDEVAEDVEYLDPWFLGKTKQGMAVPAYMDVRSIEELNGTEAQFILGIEPSSVMMHWVGKEVLPAYGLKQKLVAAPTAGMLDEVERLYTFRDEFVFLAWSPHWMNQRYDFVYLDDPENALGELNEPSRIATVVRKNLPDDDPVAYALVEALALSEVQVGDLEEAINATGDPLLGARTGAENNHDVVKPWIEAAKQAR